MRHPLNCSPPHQSMSCCNLLWWLAPVKKKNRSTKTEAISIVKVGTHWAKSCSNTSQRQITPCVQVRWWVAATRWGDMSQWQIASCVLENFCEKYLCLQNRNFVAATSRKKSNQTESVRLVVATKFCCSDKDFHKILQYTWSDLSLQRVSTTCCCNLSPSVYRPSVIDDIHTACSPFWTDNTSVAYVLKTTPSLKSAGKPNTL